MTAAFPHPLPPALSRCLAELGHIIYVPNPGNLGDELIAASTIHLFERLGVSYEIYQDSKDYGQGYTLVYGGGGIMVPEESGAHDALLSLFTAPGLGRCLILPQSLRQCRALLDVMDSRFTVFCREQESLAYARAYNTRARIELADDMAFYTAPCLWGDARALQARYPRPSLWSRLLERCGCIQGKRQKLSRFYRKTVARLERHLAVRTSLAADGKRIAFFLRRDKEAHQSLRHPLEGCPSLDLSRYGGGDCRWHDYNLLGIAQMARAIERMDIIVTDRLHVAIMAAMLERRCIMVDNSYGKLSGVWQQSMQGMPHVTLCRTEEAVKEQLALLGPLRPLAGQDPSYDGARSPLRKRWRALWKLWRARRDIMRNNRQYPSAWVKEEAEIMRELRCLIRRRAALPFQDIIPEYFALGLNYRHARLEDYIFWNEWKRQREKLDARAGHEGAILLHKQQQHALYSRHGLPVPACLGILAEQQGDVFLLTPAHARVPIEQALQQHGSLFAKPLDGYGGNGCMKLEAAGQGCLINGIPTNWGELARLIAESPRLMVEETLVQHERLAALNPTSINTLRLWTIRQESGEPAYLQGILRIGSGGSCLDNACQGGICVPLTPEGRLGTLGWQPYRIPMLPLREHPDTGLRFEGYELPLFEESRQLVLNAHRCFSTRVAIVAWDVAVTPQGPVLIEGNLWGDTTIMQTCHGGWAEIARQQLLPLVRHERANL